MKLKDLICSCKNEIHVYFGENSINFVVALLPRKHIYDDTILSTELLEADIIMIESGGKYINVYITNKKGN